MATTTKTVSLDSPVSLHGADQHATQTASFPTGMSGQSTLLSAARTEDLSAVTDPTAPKLHVPPRSFALQNLDPFASEKLDGVPATATIRHSTHARDEFSPGRISGPRNIITSLMKPAATPGVSLASRVSFSKPSTDDVSASQAGMKKSVFGIGERGSRFKKVYDAGKSQHYQPSSRLTAAIKQVETSKDDSRPPSPSTLSRPTTATKDIVSVQTALGQKKPTARTPQYMATWLSSGERGFIATKDVFPDDSDTE